MIKAWNIGLEPQSTAVLGNFRNYHEFTFPLFGWQQRISAQGSQKSFHKPSLPSMVLPISTASHGHLLMSPSASGVHLDAMVCQPSMSMRPQLEASSGEDLPWMVIGDPPIIRCRDHMDHMIISWRRLAEIHQLTDRNCWRKSQQLLQVLSLVGDQRLKTTLKTAQHHMGLSESKGKDH